MAQQPAQLSVRNFIIGIINGTIVHASNTFLDPQTVLTVFALDLMGGNVIWVGVLISLIQSGRFWPQSLLAGVLESEPRYLPYYRLSAVVRIVLRFAVWALIFFVGASQPLLLFVLVAIVLFLFSSAGGIGAATFLSIIGDTIPPTWRGKFFGLRFFLGGLVGLVAGLYVKYVLSAESGLAFPLDYAHLALLAAVAGSIAWGAFCFVEESPRRRRNHRLPLGQQLARGPRLFRRQPNFRRLVLTRAFFEMATALCLPFIVPFAVQVGGMAKAMVGLFLVARMLSFSGANVLWSYLSDNLGNRLVLLISGLLCVILPVMVLLAPRVPQTLLISAHPAFDLRTGYFLLVFAVVGLLIGSQRLGQMGYLLEVTSPLRRPTYLGFYYAVLLPLAWAPFVGALVIGSQERYVWSFGLAVAAALGSLVNAFNLGEPRDDLAHEGEENSTRRPGPTA